MRSHSRAQDIRLVKGGAWQASQGDTSKDVMIELVGPAGPSVAATTAPAGRLRSGRRVASAPGADGRSEPERPTPTAGLSGSIAMAGTWPGSWR
jgi:hypothetical protein